MTVDPRTIRTRRSPGRPVGGDLGVARDDVLAAAERVICRDGSGVSMEAIAAEVGVSKPVVYARVAGRGALADALAERLADRLQRTVADRVSFAVVDRASMAAMFTVTLESLERERELFLFVTRSSGDDAPDRSLYLAQRSSGALADLLRSVRVRHGADPAVAEAWSFAIVGMLNLTALWWMQHGGPTAHALGEQLAELVWDGVTGPQRP